eukprot:393743_1
MSSNGIHRHDIVILDCAFQLKSSNAVKIKLSSCGDNCNWTKNLKSILTRIPQKFKCISKMHDDEWLLQINDTIIHKNNPYQFGAMLLISSPPVTIKIIKNTVDRTLNEIKNDLYTENNNHLKIIYDTNSFDWTPPNLKSENGKKWN